MNQQEWIEYFELVNGRKPTPAELAQAQAAGEFILERPNPNVFGSNGQVTEQRPIKPAEPVITMTQQPQFAQTTATFQQVVPAKKGMSKKTKIILASVFGSLAAILLIVGGYSLWRYQSGKIADGTYEVVAYSYRDEDKDKMVDAFDEFDSVYSFGEVKNNKFRYYSYLEDNKEPYISLLDYEKEIPQKFDPWNKTLTEVLTVDEFEDVFDSYMKELSKKYSFYTKDATKESTKESLKAYKKSLKEKRTYVKHGDEYTVTILDEKGKLKSRITFKRMDKDDVEKRWGDYKDAVKDYKKAMKEISDQYDDYKDYYSYGYGNDYGYGYGNSDDYGSGSKSGSDDSKSSKKGVDKI